MKNKLLLLPFLFILFTVNAQDNGKISETKKDQKNAILLNFGSLGLGLGYARSFTDHLSVRVQGSYLNIHQKRDGVKLNDRLIDVDANFKSMNYEALLDYTPFKKSSFKLVSGVSHISTKGSAILIPAGEVKYGDIVIPKDKVGEINTSADWAGIASYAGIGFGRAVPKHKLGFGFEMGGYFLKKPNFIFDATKMLTPNEEQEKESHEIQNWLNKFTFLPSIMFHINYKL
ncbi:hypothetical protein [Flavobacterium psychrotolerans]|uniref:Outer membrane protein beta-barrel domain-containing protein n=1 Tax=Flavobacterium psychrotolerans TaxID=2169410 RepID=A0A2U1JP18_9FLAO|nr:hypothetical protein [Flavobacterium psychrotolerans]PWA06926.1 hypothetical protein DB895_02800 [Flavobacterium psychrotolerans]